uniref:Uncharacterized protein n=1 Tax=Lates calcarifer TaxID=8187 RepID=A0A4W6FTA7_LATCA
MTAADQKSLFSLVLSSFLFDPLIPKKSPSLHPPPHHSRLRVALLQRDVCVTKPLTQSPVTLFFLLLLIPAQVHLSVHTVCTNTIAQSL